MNMSETDKQLEIAAEEFYWAGHMGRAMPNPARSCEARAEIHRRAVMSGQKKVFGQYPYKVAKQASGGMPFDAWKKAVKRALEKGFPVLPEVLAEAGLTK